MCNVPRSRRPAQSSDPNPIEHCWVHLRDRFRSYPKAPKRVLELWKRVKAGCLRITASTCQDLIDSVPRRIEAVIKIWADWSYIYIDRMFIAQTLTIDYEPPRFYHHLGNQLNRLFDSVCLSGLYYAIRLIITGTNTTDPVTH